jgi:drug/metabolite transporter (DMT)-like permease
MPLSTTSSGLIAALIAAVSFGTSGALVKPLLEAGWSPTAAVTARALTAALVLLPIALLALRGRFAALWRGRWRVLGMGIIGVAATQLAYFASLQTIPVATALLIEFLAPLLLVGFVWVRTLRMPRPTVLLGSALAVVGLVLVIGPGALRAVDPVGLMFAFLAAIGCAVYFVVAARPGDGLPPAALAAFGLLVGGTVLAMLGFTGLLPFTATFGNLPLFGWVAPWWVPLLIVAVIGTALAYAAGIAGSAALGSRLASFVGLLEVVFASLFAWMLLGEELSALQLAGGALILGGIAAVRAERRVPIEAAGAIADALPATSDPLTSTQPVQGGLKPTI